MEFRLQALLRYRLHQRDLCRLYLGEALTADRILNERREAIEAERLLQLREGAQLLEPGRISIDRMMSRRYHLGQLQLQTRQVDLERQIVAQQIDLCRQALLQADQRVQALEKLRDKQLREAAAQEVRREERQVEEAWQALHWSEHRASEGVSR